MDETLQVRRIDLRPARRVTTQFAPERRTAWPWLGVVAILALAAIGEPYDPMQGQRSSQAGEVLRLLP